MTVLWNIMEYYELSLYIILALNSVSLLWVYQFFNGNSIFNTFSVIPLRYMQSEDINSDFLKKKKKKEQRGRNPDTDGFVDLISAK